MIANPRKSIEGLDLLPKAYICTYRIERIQLAGLNAVPCSDIVLG